MEKVINVLFVCSGNSKNFEIAPFIRSQGESLKSCGANVNYFLIKGGGLSGYWKAARELKNELKKTNIDLIHAHYCLSAFTAIISRARKPIVVSLMGDDAYGEYIGIKKVKFSSRYLTLITLLIQPFVDIIISKSKNIEKYVYLKSKSIIIPNGVNMWHFCVDEKKKELRGKLNLSQDKKLILYLGNKNDPRKNFGLVNSAVSKLNDKNIEIVSPFPVSHELLVKYYNACDVFVMPAFMEGSPNVIKEAMACGCPIVSTDVGDAKWVLGNTEGCFVSGFTPDEFAEKIYLALDYALRTNRTQGRNQIWELGIDIESTANKIVNIYKGLIS